MEFRKVIAPGETRLEFRPIKGAGIFLCDDKRWNERHHCSEGRFYISIFWGGKKRWGITFG